MNQPKTVRLLSVLLFGAAAICSIAWVVMPRQQAITRRRADIEAQRLYVEQAMVLAPQIQQLENDLETATSFVGRHAGHTVAGQELVTVFGLITSKATAAGVVVDRFQPGPTTGLHGALEQLAATLVVEGTLEQVVAFLGHLERLPMPLWLDELQLQKSEDGTENLSCEINLVVFADNPGISG